MAIYYYGLLLLSSLFPPGQKKKLQRNRKRDGGAQALSQDIVTAVCLNTFEFKGKLHCQTLKLVTISNFFWLVISYRFIYF